MNTIKTIVICTGLISGFFSAQGTAEHYLPGAELYDGNPSSCFIIRWSFQQLCDHVFDPRTGKFEQPTSNKQGGVSFNPSDVKVGDVIFVRRIHLFMQTMHPLITVPYCIVTHGDYLDTTEDRSLRYLDDEKIIAWFSIHPPKEWHPKYYPIPLGIVQKREVFAQKELYMDLFRRLRNKQKTKFLTGTFSLEDNIERVALAKFFARKPFYTPSKKNLPFVRYLNELAASVFTLSPRGWGPDSYRTWEALLAGAIPIVKRGEAGVMECVKENLKGGVPYNPAVHAQIDRLYEHLPIVVVDEWEEVTEEFLKKKYKEITSKKYNSELLYIEYWRSTIMAVKEEYLKEYVYTSAPLSCKVKKGSYAR